MRPNYLRLFRTRVLGEEESHVDARLSLPPGTWGRWERAQKPLDEGTAATTLVEKAPEVLLAGITAEELKVVASLMPLVSQMEVDLKRKTSAGVDTHANDSLEGMRYRRSTVLHELHTRAYGRVVWVRDSATGAETAYRFTQANEGVPDLHVVQRSAPIARELIPAELGDIVELPNKREVEVVAIVDLERFPTNQLLGLYDTFASLHLEALDLQSSAGLAEAKQGLAVLRSRISSELGLDGAEVAELPTAPLRRQGREEQLAGSFFTRTSHAQEAILRRGALGLTVVLGVAGSGKTSVALGRTKFLCDANGDDADPEFFRTNTAIGFVLSEQLSGYLRRAMTELLILEMKVQEYGALRRELFLQRELDQDSTYARDPGQTVATRVVEGTMAWLRSADIAMAQVVADKLEDLARTAPGERDQSATRRAKQERSAAQSEALGRVWAGFREDIGSIVADLRRDSNGANLRLERLAQRVDRARARLAERLEREPAWTGAGLSDARQAVRSAVLQRVQRAFRFSDLYAEGVKLPSFAEELNRRTGDRAGNALTAAIQRLSGKRLSDADIDVIIAIAHFTALGYQGRNQKDPISHLAEGDRYSQVFIDEFQDFSEVQLFLMGALADQKYRSLTVVGDYCQQLASRERVDLSACFPWAQPSERTPVKLLENKRQSPALAAFAQRFREDVLGDSSASDKPTGPLRGFAPRLITTRDLADATYREILSLPRDASMAVVCPDMAVAEELHRELSTDLAETWRESRVARHAELTSRQYIHFTEPLQTKGLEFDAVIVVDPRAFGLDDPAKANACYVALTRPREHLSVIMKDQPLPAFQKTVDEGLAELVEETSK